MCNGVEELAEVRGWISEGQVEVPVAETRDVRFRRSLPIECGACEQGCSGNLCKVPGKWPRRFGEVHGVLRLSSGHCREETKKSVLIEAAYKLDETGEVLRLQSV